MWCLEEDNAKGEQDAVSEIDYEIMCEQKGFDSINGAGNEILSAPPTVVFIFNFLYFFVIFPD